MSFKINTFIHGIFTETTFYIQQLALQELDKTEKKAILDNKLKEYIDTFPINFFLKAIIKKYIPTITQCIYDGLKAKISGVTK